MDFARPGLDISIHALREEGDTSRHFYPRPPRGGRRAGIPPSMRVSEISIHALREEGDIYIVDGTPILDDFYPRPPRGGRH